MKAQREAEMAKKTDAQVVIGGKTYTLSGDRKSVV